MKIAALILGIIGSMFEFMLVGGASMIVAAGSGFTGGNNASLTLLAVFAIPIGSLLGGALTFANAAIGGIMMAASAAGLAYLMGMNVITVVPLICTGLGALCALIAHANSVSTHGGEVRLRISRDQEQATERSEPILAVSQGERADHVAREAIEQLSYDTGRWSALLKYDPEIRSVAEKLAVLGQRRVDEFAKAYLALNDKSYLPHIVRKIINDARSELQR
jgi:hypothetical protein